MGIVLLTVRIILKTKNTTRELILPDHFWVYKRLIVSNLSFVGKPTPDFYGYNHLPPFLTPSCTLLSMSCLFMPLL